MYGIGTPELILIVVLLALILGPRNLPRAARKAGQLKREIDRMRGSLTSALDFREILSAAIDFWVVKWMERSARKKLWVAASVVSHLALAGIGLGLAATPVATAVINAVQATERGMAAALVLIMRLIGMTVSDFSACLAPGKTAVKTSRVV